VQQPDAIVPQGLFMDRSVQSVHNRRESLLGYGRLLGNRALQRLVATPPVARVPVAREDAAAEPSRSAPQKFEIKGSPSEAVVFATTPVTLGDLSIRFTGRLALTGSAVLVGTELPKKNVAAFVAGRVRDQLKAAFDGAKATGTAQKVEVSLGGETLNLELAPGAEKQPAFQVSGRFVAAGRSLKGSGVEVTGGSVVLDATAWIAPAKPATPVEGEEAQPPPGDTSVGKFAFGGQEVVFSGDKRTGSVSLKSDMDAFESRLPDLVKQHRYLKLPEQRAAFFQEMRAYFGSDTKTLDHFAKIRKANVKGATTWLHDEAATRLEAVQAEIGEARMPSSGGVGWPRSEASMEGQQGLGNLHNIGFAVDYNAYQAPHIKDTRILDLIAITTGRSASLDYQQPKGVDARAVGETYTRGTDEDKAKLDGDEKVQSWLERVEKEAEALGKASDDFRGSLKSKDAAGAETDNAPKLQELRAKWFAAKSKVADLKRKERSAKKADKEAAKLATAEAEKEQKAVHDELQTVLQPWKDKIAAQKTAMETAITGAGLDASTLPTGAALEKNLKAAASLATRMQQLDSKLKDSLSKSQRTQVLALITQAAKQLEETVAAPADDAAIVTEFRRLLASVETRQMALGKKKWLDRVTRLETSLTNDPAFVFGASANNTVSNPALAQLVDKGFFNLQGQAGAGKEAFGADFVKSMVKHGFGHGGTWSTPDYMHFELRWKGPGQ
jgi:hypothetical protein